MYIDYLFSCLGSSEVVTIKYEKGKDNEKYKEEIQRRKSNLEPNFLTIRKPALLAPACPLCLRKMSAPRHIFQCSNGPHLCENCYPRLKMCPQCRQPFMGRATDMEKFLRNINTPGQQKYHYY